MQISRAKNKIKQVMLKMLRFQHVVTLLNGSKRLRSDASLHIEGPLIRNLTLKPKMIF